jgi:hypothetical protein
MLAKAKVFQRLGGGSSNGRTTDSDSVNLGSNPSPPATKFSIELQWLAGDREIGVSYLCEVAGLYEVAGFFGSNPSRPLPAEPHCIGSPMSAWHPKLTEVRALQQVRVGPEAVMRLLADHGDAFACKGSWAIVTSL